MNISRVERQQAVWRQEQTSLQLQREEEYRKLVDKRKFDEIVAERVRRNIRLGLDKGTRFDAEV
jgi:hypothetical protein